MATRTPGGTARALYLVHWNCQFSAPGEMRRPRRPCAHAQRRTSQPLRRQYENGHPGVDEGMSACPPRATRHGRMGCEGACSPQHRGAAGGWAHHCRCHYHYDEARGVGVWASPSTQHPSAPLPFDSGRLCVCGSGWCPCPPPRASARRSQCPAPRAPRCYAGTQCHSRLTCARRRSEPRSACSEAAAARARLAPPPAQASRRPSASRWRVAPAARGRSSWRQRWPRSQPPAAG